MDRDVSIPDLVNASSIIFVGTVKKLKASEMEPWVRATDHTAVVQIDEVLRAGAGLGLLKDQLVTVQLNQFEELGHGAHAIFFTNGLSYGRSVAVREVARHAVDAKTTKAIAAAIEAIPKHRIKARVDGAELIVSGQVASVRAAGLPERLSFHAPKWMLATVEVSHVKKGQLKGRSVTFVFPSSEDDVWQDAPKFKGGEQGDFILHRHELPTIPAELLSVLRHDDYQRQHSAVDELLSTEATGGNP